MFDANELKFVLKLTVVSAQINIVNIKLTAKV